LNCSFDESQLYQNVNSMFRRSCTTLSLTYTLDQSSVVIYDGGASLYTVRIDTNDIVILILLF